MRSRMLVVGVCCSSALLTTACHGQVDQPAPHAAPGPTVLVYDMNEKPGTSVMTDSGNAGVDGKVGADITAGVDSQGATGYQFPTVDPKTTAVHPGHLAVIPDSAAVDPGDADYSVEIRYKTRQENGANLIQKGQATSPGGQFKIQVPEGNPQCYYKGDRGKVGATSPEKINDGAWHTLRCTRTATGVRLYVDGVLRKEHSGVVGAIDNTYPMTIGGKPDCDMVKVQCDYFGGMIDYVKINKG
jgi:Concanavalin A-like lectin/glucanases superfamily